MDFLNAFNCNSISSSIRESILSAIYVLKPFWKSLQFQTGFKASKVNGDVKLSDGRFLPRITFLGSDEKPTSYATRNCYPVQNEETVRLHDQRLDKLIKETSLAVARHRVCYVYDERMTLHRNVNEP